MELPRYEDEGECGMTMLRKIIYETDEHRVIIQKSDNDWLLQVFEGTGGTHVVEWKEFKSLNRVKSYVKHKYFVQERESDE